MGVARWSVFLCAVETEAREFNKDSGCETPRVQSTDPKHLEYGSSSRLISKLPVPLTKLRRDIPMRGLLALRWGSSRITGATWQSNQHAI
jgi:hypothetical protein